ncbi:hypothetical protein HYR99_00900 [Candidatus Poribacteria bacterium]|nr:hypothetical protein [Candidatus Poribacteria bacterium]
MTTPKRKKSNKNKHPKKYLVMGKYYTKEQLEERIGMPLGEGSTDAVARYLKAHYGKDKK